MNELQTKFPTDTWVCNSWDEYVRLLNSHTKSQGLLLQWTTAIEMSPVGSDHASAHTIIFAVNLFATLKASLWMGEITVHTEKQVSKNANLMSLVTLERPRWFLGNYDCKFEPSPPNLVVKLPTPHSWYRSKTSAVRGSKSRWILGGGCAEHPVIAFAIIAGGSRRITQSQALSGLAISLLEEALRSWVDQTQVGAWLLAQFQNNSWILNRAKSLV